VIPEAQHAIALGFQKACTRDIRCIVGVLAAISLHNQPLSITQKINDIRPDWNLPSELVRSEAPVPQQIPQGELGWRRGLAHGFCASAQYPLTPLA
jgi:hypothetical protein